MLLPPADASGTSADGGGGGGGQPGDEQRRRAAGGGQSDAAPPLFGLDDVGSVVPFAEATAPPLPRHPLVSE